MIYVFDNQKALKYTFQATKFKAEESSRPFQGLAQKFTRTFQGKMEFKNFSRLWEPGVIMESVAASTEAKRISDWF